MPVAYCLMPIASLLVFSRPMKKLLFALALVMGIFSNAFAQAPSPEQFLGYKPGEKYTPHYKIANYVRAVAAAKPEMVKVEKYGETYEGRELLLVYVSSGDNMRQLENIRTNNLQLVNSGGGNTNTAIVWLSYNVHGNEPSSSEAAMATLYALVDPSNTKAKEWLKNTVVIIDPCINPDGRDRYVNWFNSVSGKEPNADPQTREHIEPWPGGRSNHYNFDLNSDWAWQTQVETQHRIKKYNEWMPHVHVDFHEQYYNDPYYFAPAAEPFHEIITPWQREFQTMIGKNHANYFDKEGWLYFTKERFDLFYPSYGDTYPTYNGAIGMTYEQGGHSAGGLSVATNTGDTLRLTDRVMHHHTTGLSTIETASKNAQRLVSEFKSYFDDSRSGKAGEYKTYILTTNDKSKLLSLTQLLERNGIEYGTTIPAGKGKGFHFFTGKDEDVQLQQHSIAVSVAQPKGALASVLLEPSSKLSDTATYDITAWSLPYAYGVDAFALKEKRTVTPAKLSNDNISTAAAQYGYLIPYTSFAGAKTLAYLLKNGVKVRVADKPFTYRSKNFGRGTMIVLRTSNTGNWQQVVAAAGSKYNIQPEVLETGFVEKGADLGSGDVRFVKAPKVAMITGQQSSSINAGEVWHLFDQGLDYPVSMINAADITRTTLSAYDVIVFPSGFYSSLNDKAFLDRLKEYVRNGGKVVAIANAVNQLAGAEWGLKAKEDKTEDKSEYANLKKYGDRERNELPNSIPGAIYKVELDETHPLAFGYADLYYTLKLDTDVYEFLKDGWNVGVIKKENYVAGFAGSKVKPRLKDGLLFGVQNIGRGSVVYLTDDPLFRMFWENGKLMFANAVFLVQ